MNNKQKAGRWSETPGRQQRKVLEQGQPGEDGEAVISRSLNENVLGQQHAGSLLTCKGSVGSLKRGPDGLGPAQRHPGRCLRAGSITGSGDYSLENPGMCLGWRQPLP